jgi:hypothetical protein
MAMTIAQYESLLTAVDTAIAGVLSNGQAAGSEGRTYTKADLGQLTQLREHYVQMIERLNMTAVNSRRVAEF